jgi:hypothetical protein
MLVLTSPECSARQWIRLSNFPHLGTEMVGLKIDRYTMGSEHRLEGVCDLLPHPLLYGEAPGEQPHERPALEADLSDFSNSL